jgi:hypothetical protein
MCYQETATGTSPCGQTMPGRYAFNGAQNRYFEINYTKPYKANQTSKWQVRYASGLSANTTTNFTIPAYCWNASGTILQLRLYGGNISGSLRTGLHCFNSTHWVSIYSLANNTPYITGGIANTVNLNDSNWNTYLVYSNGVWYNNGFGENSSKLMEEAMWWNISKV